MKKLLFLLMFLMLASGISYSQLANQNMVLLAQKDERGNGYSGLWGWRAPNGREYAILGCQTGTSFYDITDSTNIRECDFVTGVNSGWREMKVFSHYAYVISEGLNSRLQVIDMQYLPDSVSLITVPNMTNHSTTHTISQEGPYLYLHGGNTSFGRGTVIVDISNPILPVKLGAWNTLYVHDARIVNDTMFAANINDGPISVINVTNKNSPVLITSWVNNPSPGPHNVAITSDRKYAYTTDEIPQGTLPRQLKVWNIQNLTNVTLAATWRPTGMNDSSIVHNVEIYGNTAVIAHYTAGIRVLNITNPTAPVEIAWYDTFPQNNRHSYSGCWAVYMFPSGKIIGSDISGGLFVVRPTVQVPVSTGNNNSTVADKFELQQNYPNPFNPSTSINFSIPKSEHVSIKVFDALGRQVGTLVDEYKTAGSHKVNYDGANLSSGVYFYTLTAGSYRETKRMTLVK